MLVNGSSNYPTRHMKNKILLWLGSVFNLWWENREGENLDQPVHILILVSVDGSTIFHPADGGFGNAGGLAGQGGLNVDCNRHIVTAVSDGRRNWRNNIAWWLQCLWVRRFLYMQYLDLQHHPPYTCRSTLFCCVPAGLVAMHRYRPVSVTWVEWMCSEPSSANVYLHIFVQIGWGAMCFMMEITLI